jgi:hypothetical protein
LIENAHHRERELAGRVHEPLIVFRGELFRFRSLL